MQIINDNKGFILYYRIKFYVLKAICSTFITSQLEQLKFNISEVNCQIVRNKKIIKFVYGY